MQPLVHPTADSLKHSERRQYAHLMYESAHKHSVYLTIPHTDRCRLVLLVERGCYNRAIADAASKGWEANWNSKKFAALYSTHCNKYINALAANSGYYVNQLVNGTMDPAVDYTNIELDPESTQSERSLIEKRREQKVHEKYFKSKQCHKCGGKKIVGCEYQSRAADEGSSFSYKCTECGNVWRK